MLAYEGGWERRAPARQNKKIITGNGLVIPPGSCAVQGCRQGSIIKQEAPHVAGVIMRGWDSNNGFKLYFYTDLE